MVLGRTVEFLVVWAVVGWLMGVLMLLGVETVTSILGLHGGYLGVMYSV